MKNLWRFFVSKHKMSGIVVATSQEEAKRVASYYLSIQFDDIGETACEEDICVWLCEDDDDFREDFPHALATNY